MSHIFDVMNQMIRTRASKQKDLNAFRDALSGLDRALTEAWSPEELVFREELLIKSYTALRVILDHLKADLDAEEESALKP